MSEVTPSQAIGQVPVVEPERDLPHESAEQKAKDEKDQPEEEHTEQERRVEDMAIILGVPASDITPQIHNGLNNVMNEFERQRRELDYLRKRVAFLEKKYDAHPFLSIKSRHALERAMTKVLNRADQAYTENSFVCFQLEGLESVRHTKGLSVADLIVSNTANMIKSELRASDILGSMGGYGLGVIFTVTTYEGAEEKVGQLAPAIESKLQATYAELRLVYGIHPLKTHETVTNIFSAADADLRRRFG